VSQLSISFETEGILLQAYIRYFSKIVCVLKVHHPHVKTKEALPPPIELPAGTNIELFSATFGLMGRLRADNGFDSEKDYSQYQPKLCSSSTSHKTPFYTAQAR
jgi:hypothetical protein